jgi:hypothetical protein
MASSISIPPSNPAPAVHIRRVQLKRSTADTGERDAPPASTVPMPMPDFFGGADCWYCGCCCCDDPPPKRPKKPVQARRQRQHPSVLGPPATIRTSVLLLLLAIPATAISALLAVPRPALVVPAASVATLLTVAALRPTPLALRRSTVISTVIVSGTRTRAAVALVGRGRPAGRRVPARLRRWWCGPERMCPR